MHIQSVYLSKIYNVKLSSVFLMLMTTDWIPKLPYHILRLFKTIHLLLGLLLQFLSQTSPLIQLHFLFLATVTLVKAVLVEVFCHRSFLGSLMTQANFLYGLVYKYISFKSEKEKKKGEQSKGFGF